MDDILTVVRESLNAPPTAVSSTSDANPELVYPLDEPQIYTEEEQEQVQSWNVEQMFDPNEMLFDDTGEGAGVEGDLDMEED